MRDQTDDAIAGRERTRARLEGDPVPSERNAVMLTAVQQINGRLDSIERMLVIQLKFTLRTLDLDDPLRDEIVGMLATHQDYDEMRHGG